MSGPRYRGMSGPPGQGVACPVPGCHVSRSRAADIQHHVRRCHSDVVLSQAQHDAINSMYCVGCGELCSRTNRGAKHKLTCKQRNRSGAEAAERPRPSARRGRSHSRSRSPCHNTRASSLPTAAPGASHCGAPTLAAPPASVQPHADMQPPLSAGLGSPTDDFHRFLDGLHGDGLAPPEPTPHLEAEGLPADVVMDPPTATTAATQPEWPAELIDDIGQAVGGLDLEAVDHNMFVVEGAPASAAAPPPVAPPEQRPSAVSPIAPEVRPAAWVPYQSRFRHGEATGRLLQLCKDAAHRGEGQGVTEAVDLLLQLPGLVLTGGAGRSRHRKVNKRLELLMQDRMDELRTEPAAPAPASARRSQRRPTDEAALKRKQAQRARRQLELGSVQRSARTLNATGLAEVSDGVLQQLHSKHPQAEPPTLPTPSATSPPPVAVTADCLRAVLDNLPRGSAPGPSGWTYEMIRSALLHDATAFDGGLWLINAQLAGTLPHCANLLASRLIPIAKHTAEELLLLPADAIPDVRPIAIGEVWHRLAGLCLLASLPEVGPSLQPHQLGVGVRGGAQIVGHAVRAGAAAADTVTLQVDIKNAFNSVSREAVLQQVFERAPGLGPWAAFAYGTPSTLYVDGAPADSTPLSSSDGVRQGDPTGPLLFALALQPVLEEVAQQHPGCSLVAYADDITLQGPQHAVQAGFRSLCTALEPLRLRVNPLKSSLYSSDADLATETAANLGCKAATLLVIAGTPIGDPGRIKAHVHSRVAATEACIDTMLGLPLSPQEQHLLLHGSLQHREDHLPRVVEWALLQDPMQRLEAKIVAAVKAIADLSDADLQAPQLTLLHLPHRHGGFALQKFDKEIADASFLSAAALADNAMARGPQQLRPFANAGAPALRAQWEELRRAYPDVCPHELPPDVLVHDFLPELQRTLTRARAQREFQQLVDHYSTESTAAEPGAAPFAAQAQRDCARLRSSACKPASAWLTTLPTSPALRLQAEEFLSSFRLRLGLSVLHQDTERDVVECFCHRRVHNAHSDHSLVCQSVKRTITSRHHLLVASWRRIMGRAGVATTREPSLAEHLHADTARQPRAAAYGDVLAMLPRRLTITDVSVIHPGADTYVRRAAGEAGAAAEIRDKQKYEKYNRAGSAVYRVVPLSHESYGRMGQPASRLLNELANIASGSGAVAKGAFVESALQELSVALCRGNHRIVSAYAALNTRITGSALIPGLPVPTADAGAMDAM